MDCYVFAVESSYNYYGHCNISKKYNAKVVQLASNTKECIVMFKIYLIFLFKLWIT